MPSRWWSTPLALLKTTQVAIGITAVLLLFMGQFALFTYLRPFLEQVTGVDVTTLSALLLVLGLAGFVGTTFVGRLLHTRLHATLSLAPFIMSGVALALAALGASLGVTTALLAVWGLVGTAAPIAWFTWMSRALPEDAEAGGGLMVGVIQTAITVGATAGGLVLDAAGPRADFAASAGILALAALVALLLGRLAAPFCMVLPAGDPVSSHSP